jgi:hypothetical protein
MGKWKTTIKELLLNYKGALQSIIPWLDKSNIPYKEGEAYDEWDTITSTIFETIVINSINYSDELTDKKDFPKYDFQYQDYNNLNLILCENPIGKNEFLVFVSFSTVDNFEMINTCIIAKDSLIVKSRSKIKLSDANFYLNQKIPLENINLEV